MVSAIRQQLARMRRMRDFQHDLQAIWDTPEGKRFFAVFLDHCGVVNPRFARDPQEIVWNESRRHLAMSYLKLLAQDDAEAVLRRLEESLRDKESEEPNE